MHLGPIHSQQRRRADFFRRAASLALVLVVASAGFAVGSSTSGQLVGLPDVDFSVLAASGKNLLLGPNAATMITCTSGGGIQVGSPTGGDKGANTLNTAGTIYTNGSALSVVTTVAPTTGTAASAGGANALAVGVSANASTTDSTAVGTGATASTANNTTAIGRAASATGSHATCLGDAATCSVTGICVGFAGNVSGAGSIQIGATGNTMSGTNTVSIGESQVIGANNDSIAMGTGASLTASNQAIFGSPSHLISAIFFGGGNTSGTAGVDNYAPWVLHGTPGNAAAGCTVTLRGGDVGTATASKAGGDAIIQAGNATGLGGSNVTIQTGFKNGTTTALQTYGTRTQIIGKVYALSTTTATAANLFTLNVPTSNSSGGCIVKYTVEANDGTNWNTAVGSFAVACSNKATAVTATTSAITDEATNANSGTITAGTTGKSVAGTAVTITIAPAWTVITPTTVQATVNVEAFGIGVTITP